MTLFAIALAFACLFSVALTLLYPRRPNPRKPAKHAIPKQMGEFHHVENGDHRHLGGYEMLP